MRKMGAATTLAAVIGIAVATPAAAAEPMSVAAFLGKAESLRKKGPLALLSGDVKLLTGQIKADSEALKAENKALAAAGKRKSYCTPDGFSMNQNGIMDAMREVPAAKRPTTSTRAALRDYLARRHPCQG